MAILLPKFQNVAAQTSHHYVAPGVLGVCTLGPSSSYQLRARKSHPTQLIIADDVTISLRRQPARVNYSGLVFLQRAFLVYLSRGCQCVLRRRNMGVVEQVDTKRESPPSSPC